MKSVKTFANSYEKATASPDDVHRQLFLRLNMFTGRHLSRVVVDALISGRLLHAVRLFQ